MPSNSTPTKLSLAHVVFFCDNALSDKKIKLILSVMSKEPNKTDRRIQRDKNH